MMIISPEHSGHKMLGHSVFPTNSDTTDCASVRRVGNYTTVVTSVSTTTMKNLRRLSSGRCRQTWNAMPAHRFRAPQPQLHHRSETTTDNFSVRRHRIPMTREP